MNIVEQHLRGKHPDQDRCEDVIVTAGHLVAVVDGATDKSGLVFPTSRGPITGGRFAALAVADALRAVPASTAPRAAVDQVTAALGDAITSAVGDLDPIDLPCAVAVVFDLQLNMIWRVGDCPFRVDDTLFPAGKEVDRVAAAFRAALTATYAAGDPDDEARAAIMPLLRRQAHLANRPGEFGYGVLNGTHVPDTFLEVVEVPEGAAEVVLASDGYPDISGTLADAEAVLAQLLEADPECVNELRGTKGVQPGAESFDDRAWVHLAR